MTIDQFFSKYNGRFIDFDGKYGFQCVDLIRQYIKEVLGKDAYAALLAGPTAKSIFQNFPAGGNKHFIKILNGKYNAPKKGDLVFWGWYPFVTGWAGHTAIASVAWTMGLNSFDQNYPKGSFCKFTTHSYKGVLGWISPRK